MSAQKAKQISFQHGHEHDARVQGLPESPDSITPELLIRPTQGKDYLLWHFTGRGGWEYYIDAQDESIRNAISPIRNSFHTATGKILSTKDLSSGAVVTFHLSDDPNPRFGECGDLQSWPPEWDPNWSTPYLFEDDLSTGTIKVIVYDANDGYDSTNKMSAHCEECDIFLSYGDPDCCLGEDCCSCETSWCEEDYPCITVPASSLDLATRYQNPQHVSAIYYTGKVYEFYKENFGLDGYKGNGSETRIVVNYEYEDSNGVAPQYLVIIALRILLLWG